MRIVLVGMSILLGGCAILHNYQIGNIDNRDIWHREPIDTKISETGVNLQEIKLIAEIFAQNKQVRNLLFFIQLFQMGPTTGNIVSNPNYAQTLPELLAHKCPDGKTTDLNSIREMGSYPTVRGEVVKITGYCLTKI